jgi:hypothetical protein
MKNQLLPSLPWVVGGARKAFQTNVCDHGNPFMKFIRINHDVSSEGLYGADISKNKKIFQEL